MSTVILVSIIVFLIITLLLVALLLDSRTNDRIAIVINNQTLDEVLSKCRYG